MKLYYKIWVDAITKIRNFDDYMWKSKTLITISFWMGVVFMVFVAIFEHDILGFTFYKLNLDNYIAKPWCDLFESILLFFMPFIVINYFLIFYKKRYETLLKKYEYKNGKYFTTFFLCCMGLPLLCFLILIIRNIM